ARLRLAATESVVAAARPSSRRRPPRTCPQLAVRSAPAALRPPSAPGSARSSGAPGTSAHAHARVRRRAAAARAHSLPGLATARCRKDDAPSGRGEGSGGRGDRGDPSWGGAGTCGKPRRWGRRACGRWEVGRAADPRRKEGRAGRKFSLGQVKVFRALYTFEPRTVARCLRLIEVTVGGCSSAALLGCSPDELYFEEGDIIYITDMSDTNWWKGTSKGRTGLIPSNYVAEQAESIDNPLHEAAKRGNLSWLRECLDNRVGVNGLDKAGSTALYWACHGGHKDIVEMLFTQPNIELNQQNKLGDTALHAAAWKGYADIVQLLLEKGARTDLRNNEKKLALDMATNAACASLLKKKQGTDAVRTLSNAEEYLDDEDSD
uniref:Osteoclast-stimulating factor 1 n=1 Tax=Canis lupus familiaris TaxID=9615 RepID=A0A8C0RY41_CANLF